MKSIYLCLLITIFCNSIHAQSIKILANNIIQYNDKDIARLEKKGCENMQEFCLYIIQELQTDNFLIAANVFNLHEPATIQNPEGNKIFYYLNLSFNGFEHTAEIDFPNLNIEESLAIIFQENLITDNQLNKENIAAFIKEQGTKYSDKNPNVLFLKEED